MKNLFTSECVRKGHPDKICDLLSDAILDAYLKEDKDSRVAVEVMAYKEGIFISGEVTSKGKPDLESLHTLIESCLNAIAGKNKNDFKKDTYIVFYQALNVAYSMNEDNSKVEVEEAYKNLLVAFNNLEEIK